MILLPVPVVPFVSPINRENGLAVHHVQNSAIRVRFCLPDEINNLDTVQNLPQWGTLVLIFKFNNMKASSPPGMKEVKTMYLNVLTVTQ
jgi:hypothetical protein